MVNQDVVIGQRRDVSLVHDLDFGIGLGGNLATEIVMEQDIGDGYFLATVINQEMAFSHGQDKEYHDVYDQGSEYENKYDPVDEKAVNSEDDHGTDSHDRDLVIASSVDELRFPDDNELAALENCEVDENFGVISPHHSVVQPQVLITTPVVQSCTVIPLPAHEFSVGQEFPAVKSCHRALRDVAIALHFEIQTVKSDKTRFTAKYASEGCPWCVHAAKLPGVPTFTIRTIHSEHNCGG